MEKIKLSHHHHSGKNTIAFLALFLSSIFLYINTNVYAKVRSDCIYKVASWGFHLTLYGDWLENKYMTVM